MVKTIDIQGFPHTYELSAPTGSPVVLVFIHGWLLSRAYWQPVIERLSPLYQCLAYDLRGFGESQLDAIKPTNIGTRVETSVAANLAERVTVGASAKSPPSLAWEVETAIAAPTTANYTPAAYAQDLNLLLQQLDIRKVWLIGHSLGGSIALWAADQAPQTIDGVICVNSGGGIYLKEEFERFRTVGKMLVKLRPRWLSYFPLLDLPLARMNVARPLALNWARQRLVDLVAAQPEAALGALLDSTTEAEVHRLPQVVARLQQPVHFIAGANDTMMEPKYVHHLASFHPSFEFCGNNVSEISDCGHLSMVEQPDAVANEIQTVLAKYLG
ncbi:alpha/beta hydrolase [Leptolyngbya sp. NK1-12]|uniref:Alpha/beta hydrolase n=1 Tax=Leptolyngbya sp. NK1-12 TaxID=2547451 RepID=A0AA96W824_9CYAN|nr:alpha/beta hydrolase [Leptolyngbya sp. NK1-12]WNZ21457.1 alpha/beta hydrolase [Leptolyngbya sp. NK1-12]